MIIALKHLDDVELATGRGDDLRVLVDISAKGGIAHSLINGGIVLREPVNETISGEPVLAGVPATSAKSAPLSNCVRSAFAPSCVVVIIS